MHARRTLVIDLIASFGTVLLVGCQGGDEAVCSADERVEAGACVPCPPGQTREAGDDPSGADTNCDVYGGRVFISSAPSLNEVRIRDARTLAIVGKLSGEHTGLDIPTGVAVSTVRREIFVKNGGDDSITVYPLDASGNVAPLRRVAGPMTGLRSIGGWQSSFFAGLFVDDLNEEFGVAEPFGDPDVVGDSAIAVFPLTAAGDVAPLRRVSWGVTDLTGAVVDVDLDTTNDEIVLTGTATGASTFAFDRTANGAALPLWILGDFGEGGHGIAVDTIRDELWLAGWRTSVYKRGASPGDLAPRERQGRGSQAVSVDNSSGEAVVLRFDYQLGQGVLELLDVETLSVRTSTTLDALERDIVVVPWH